MLSWKTRPHPPRGNPLPSPSRLECDSDAYILYPLLSISPIGETLTRVEIRIHTNVVPYVIHILRCAMFLLTQGSDSEVTVQQSARDGYSVTVKRKDDGNVPQYRTQLSLVEAAQYCANLRNDGVKVPARFVIDFLQMALDSVVTVVEAGATE